MQVLNNEIRMTQGEQITLDFLLQNKDGSPYIISNKLKYQNLMSYNEKY